MKEARMARFGGLGLAAATAVVGLTSLTWAQGDTAKGTVTVGATKITLTSGMAVSYKAPNGQLISVVLSDKPVDRQEFATDTKTNPGEPLVSGVFEGAWKSQHFGRKLSGFTFSFGADASIIGDEFLVGGRNNTFSLSGGEYVLEVKSRSPRLVGRIRTKTPVVDAGSTKAGLDATFDLAVESRP
jgi:hypothetical protein